MVKKTKYVCRLKDGTDGVVSTASTATSNPLPTLYCYDISGSNDREGIEADPRPRCAKARMLKPFSNQTIDSEVNRFCYIHGMFYCSSECGSISVMQLYIYAQFIATRMYIHFMCGYVYFHLNLFVIPLIY